jgi:hypothetical protein
MWGRTVFTDHSSGCLRSIYLKNKGIKTPFDETHTIRGKMNEDDYERQLKEKGIEYTREYKILEPVTGFHDCYFTGSVDFLVDGPQCSEVHELKSTQSKSRYYAIKRGEWVTENLAQAVAYMTYANTVVGKLVYTFWEAPKGKTDLEPKFDYVHEILIDNAGRINLNSVPTRYTVYDVLAHQHAALKVLQDDLIWDRPHNWDLPWGSPCTHCPFKASCDAYDSGVIEGAVAFVDHVNSSLGVPNEQCNPEV